MSKQNASPANSTARPLVSEQASTIVNDESVKSPDRESRWDAQEALGPKILRYEMFCRDNLGDQPIRDEDGTHCVYINPAIAIAHLDELPECDMNEPAPRVYFYRAVYEVDTTEHRCGIGSCTRRDVHNHWFNGLRAKLVTKEIEVRECRHKGVCNGDANGPHKGEVIERTYVNESQTDRAAMRAFRDMRNARLNATADSRSSFKAAQREALLTLGAEHVKIAKQA
jgi:hypothetical protein